MFPSKSNDLLNTPRFGCRQIAFMSEAADATADQQAMLMDLLTENPNSLKAQSNFRTHAFRDGVTTPLHEEDLLKDPQDGNPHGWGYAAYCTSKDKAATVDSLEIQRSLEPAYSDNRFDTVGAELVGKAPKTLLAHILHKLSASRIMTSNEDTHPFSFENWSSMFNGTFSGARNPEIVNALENTYYPLLGKPPKGTNSGEKMLMYFLGKLKQQCGSINSQAAGIKNMQRAFAETLRDFFKVSVPVYWDLDGSVSGLKGKVQWGPSANYIMSDGNVLMAYRKGRKLYLNRHTGAAGKLSYLVSSEPIQPKNQKLSWLELPQDHILTLSRGEDGVISPTLTPLSEALAPTPAVS